MGNWNAERAQTIARGVVEGRSTPQLEELTPQRVLDIAVAAARSKGFAEYADFQDDMLLEILAGRKPNEIGYRLFEIEKVLKAHFWTKGGRPARFVPPPGARLPLSSAGDFDYEPLTLQGGLLSEQILKDRR